MPIKLLSPVQVNYQGHIVPGLITKAYDEQPEDSDEAVDIHAFVSATMNVPGNLAFVPGCRHAANKANPKAKRFVFLGEDIAMLDPANDVPEAPAAEDAATEGESNAGE